jgi:Tfp pilus assembly protein PilO
VSALTRSKAGVIGLAAVLTVVLCAGGWLLLVGPKRSKSSELDERIAGVESQVAERRTQLQRPRANVRVRASDLYRLTKALPDEVDVPGIILELGRLAGTRGVAVSSITPSPQVAAIGYAVQPVSVSLEGRFSSVSGFLGDIRRLVRVRKGTLDVRGRLFSVDDVSLGQPEQPKTFPSIKATVTIDAFLFTGSLAAGAAATGTAAPATDNQTPSNGTVAAGANP